MYESYKSEKEIPTYYKRYGDEAIEDVPVLGQVPPPSQTCQFDDLFHQVVQDKNKIHDLK